MALGRLIASDQPDVQPLVEMTRGLKFSAEGRMVRGSLSVDAGKVREFLEEHEHDRDDDDQGDDDDD